MATETKELIRDYVAPDGRVVRVVARIAPELLTWPLGRQIIDRDFELVAQVKMKEAAKLELVGKE